MDEKATIVLGEMSETCFTIFLILFNGFTPLVMSFLPTCTYRQACFSVARQDFVLFSTIIFSGSRRFGKDHWSKNGQ